MNSKSNSRKFNFGSGPATLPVEVLEEVKEEILDWRGLGLSVMEISHRSDDFQQITNEAESDFRDLLNIPTNYQVLFLHGGASMQFPMIPLNFGNKDSKKSFSAGQSYSADYINSGYWAKKAISEGSKFLKVNVAASSEEKNFTYFPSQESWEIEKNSCYIHLTPNETIGGIQIQKIEKEKLPIIADYSSSILSGPIEVTTFGMIYGGAQKNIGPAGLGFSIIRKSLLERVPEDIPTMLNYRTLSKESSMYNTPPTFAWYVAGKVFKWLKKQGGLEKINEVNQRKAVKLYNFIDESNFYSNNIEKSSRSLMNVPFLLKDEVLNHKFIEESSKEGLLALKGHRSVGGMRASLYNALPEEGVDTLIGFMHYFEKQNL